MSCMCQCYEKEAFHKHIGDGLVDIELGGGRVNVKKAVRFLTTKREAGKYSPSMKRLLKKAGDEKVESIKIVRTPLGKFLTDVLDFVSLGAYKEAVKSSGYDSMFHLAMVINGKYTLDKQAVVVLSTKNPIRDNSETIDVDIKNGMTIKELIEKTKSFMGDEKFSNYDAHTNNCQDFILAVLEANGLLSPSVKSFVKQDADSVFKNIPEISEKIAKFATDVGAVVDKVVQGGKFEVKKVQHGRFQVVNVDTGHVHAKSTTKRNAEKQLRLLNAVVYGDKKPTKNISVNKEMPSWRDFVKQEMEHRGSMKPTEYMKKIAEKWRKMKKNK